MSSVPARPASTVVLVRPARDGFEVFLVRRHDRIAFMGGAHVFPGGRVDPADEIADPDRWCDGVAGAVSRLPARDPGTAVAFHVAAIRELFEEAGVLLARGADGEIASMHGDEGPRFAAHRRALLGGSAALRDIAERERLRLALDALVVFAHWITPDVETRRFDTHFFLAAAPDRQDALHDDGETSDSLWIRPGDALDRCRSGRIALPPPTWTTLRALAACGDVEDARRWAEAQPVVPVQPRINRLADDAREILLPDHVQALETRFVLKDGRWTPER